jgi:hypothetical protein
MLRTDTPATEAFLLFADEDEAEELEEPDDEDGEEDEDDDEAEELEEAEDEDEALLSFAFIDVLVGTIHL